MRAIAQMISLTKFPLYPFPRTVTNMVGALSTGKLEAACYTGWLPYWYVFTPWGLRVFILFMSRRWR